MIGLEGLISSNIKYSTVHYIRKQILALYLEHLRWRLCQLISQWQRDRDNDNFFYYHACASTIERYIWHVLSRARIIEFAREQSRSQHNSINPGFSIKIQMACGPRSKQKKKKEGKEEEREREGKEKPIVLNAFASHVLRAWWMARARPRSDAPGCNSHFHNTDVKK